MLICFLSHRIKIGTNPYIYNQTNKTKIYYYKNKGKKENKFTFKFFVIKFLFIYLLLYDSDSFSCEMLDRNNGYNLYLKKN